MTTSGKIRALTQNNEDFEDEFEVSEEEAARLWNEQGLRMLGQRELRLLGYNEEQCA